MGRISPEKVFESIGRYLPVEVIPLVLDLEKSQGNRLHDARTGRNYLDCLSFFASNPIGFNHPMMHEPAFEKKLLRAARVKPSCSDFFTVEMAEFVDTFGRVAVPAEFRHLFFVEGGALAVENALKVAFDWKVRKNFAAGAKAEIGSKIIHFKEAFHGRTGYTLTMTNTADPRKIKYFPKFDWPRISNPKVEFPLTEQSMADVAERELASLAECEAAFAKYGDDIAAIILEPIQGEGGDNHFRAEFHKELRRLADEREVLLIYDEVQSGLGITGKMWAYQHYGITPDIVCFGKKSQVCGIMAGTRVDNVENNVFAEASRINSTWGGNLVDMVRFERYLEVIEEEKLVENAERVGAHIVTSLQQLAAKNPELLSNARGRGLMSAIDFPTTEIRNAVKKSAFDNGVLFLQCGVKSIRFRPSLNFSEAEADEALSALEQACRSVG